MIKNPLQAILYGVCVGDALGVPVEFESREYLKNNPVTKMQNGGIHDQEIGTWSDDSSLTFCLAEAIIEGFDIQKLANKFIAWKNEAYWTANNDVFDIGIGTYNSIQKLEMGVAPELSGGMEENDNGNGSLMRILPLVLLTKDKPIAERYALTKQVSSITHRHSRSINACFYYLEFAKQILEGKDKFEIYENLQSEVSNYLKSIAETSYEIGVFDRILKGTIAELSEDEILSSGYVIHTLEASIWCLLTTNSYEEAVLKALNLGLDTDTTGAVTGGLAGLYYGFESIPQTWIDAIKKTEEINELIGKYNFN